jgi:hypothetical protein
MLTDLAMSIATGAPAQAAKSMLWPWAIRALRVVAAGTGLTIFALGSAMYEDEEGRLQNRIKRFQKRVENWWIKVDDRRRTSLPWAASFIQEVARLAGRCFDRILTKRLLSMRVVGVSILLSTASIFLFIALMPVVFHTAPIKRYGDAIMLFFRLCLLALLPAISDSPSMPLKPWFPRVIRLWWWAIIIFGTLTIVDFLLFTSGKGTAGASFASNAAIFLPLLFGFGAACDVSYILFTRWTLRRIAVTNSTRAILLWIFLLLLFLAAIVVALPLVGVGIFTHVPLIGGALLFSVIINSIDVVMSLAMLLIAVLLLAHRLIWPLIQRPLYAIQRLEFKNPKEWKRRKGWFRVLGVSLIIIAIPGFPEWLKELLEKF